MRRRREGAAAFRDARRSLVDAGAPGIAGGRLSSPVDLQMAGGRTAPTGDGPARHRRNQQEKGQQAPQTRSFAHALVESLESGVRFGALVQGPLQDES